MNKAIEALRADRDALLEICAGFTPADWQAESGCAGWTVQDVVSHMAATFWGLVEPARLPDMTGLPFEDAMDLTVQTRRELSPEAVLDEYADGSERGLRQMTRMAALSFDVPIRDAGTYPSAIFPTAYSFDHYIHIRSDLFAPRGPLTGPPPPSDELRLESALDFVEAALPQQNREAAQAGRFELRVTGPSARIMRFGTGQAMATVTAAAPTLFAWITHRAAWDDLAVQATGDEPALSIARQLKVF